VTAALEARINGEFFCLTILERIDPVVTLRDPLRALIARLVRQILVRFDRYCLRQHRRVEPPPPDRNAHLEHDDLMLELFELAPELHDGAAQRAVVRAPQV